MNSDRSMIDSSWTLFLDRDGVINRRIPDGYVKSWDEFEFLPGVPEAVRLLSGIFGYIIVVSNQQGVGKGLMSSEDVEKVHLKMIKEIDRAGGRIDKVYFCPFLEKDHSLLRKPNIGMALKARKELPGIAFKRSVMVGDSRSDMLFGKRLHMKTVFISDNLPEIRKYGPLVDFAYPDLISFAHHLSTPTSRSSSRNMRDSSQHASPVHQLTSSPPHHLTSSP